MKIFFTIIFFLITNTSFSQKNIDSLILTALNNKEPDFFKLKKHFKGVLFTDKKINSFLEKSIKGKYYLGQIFAKDIQGSSFRKITIHEKAITKFEEALEIARKIKNIAAEIVILNQLGIVYRRLNKIRFALNYHQEALKIIASISNPNDDIKASNSIAINSIGNIYLALKQYERALDKFKQCLVIQETINDRRGLAINHQNIGFAHKKIGNLDIALDNFKKSLTYNELNKDKLGKVICHNSIADVLIRKGRYKEAYVYIIEVVVEAEKIGNKYYLSEVYNTLSWVFLKLKKYKKAQEYLNKSLKIELENNIPSNLVVTYDHLSELNIKKENYKKALYFCHKSIETAKKIFNDKNILYINSLINKYDSEVSTNKVKNLAIENEIATIKILRNRNILIGLLVLIGLLAFLLYSIYRQRLLKNDKQILLLEQEALRIQMNPHFVFNALNSIKLYIINNEQKNAVYYLNKFSKLIRNILESTTVKEVTLGEELKTINLYMSIENIRFSNAIIYIENISPTFNLETVKVPPLILQPFLENAIWHGLSSKRGTKKVELSVIKISKEFIQIEIEDNGIGREAAFKIKSNKTLNRKSIGIDLTKERLKNFSTQFQNEYSLVYIDLVKENGEVKGTKVVLKIPLV